MWLAHLLTLSRLPLAALFWFVADRPDAAIAVLAAAGVTDLLDGRLARADRRRRGAPEDAGGIGGWLDPLCDKAFVIAVLIAIWARHDPPVPVVVAIAARELVLVPAVIVYRVTPAVRARLRYRFRAGPIGKAATACQFVAILSVLTLPALAPALAALAAIVGLLAAARYLGQGVRLARA
jgi:phosphatidylglycerophosphate synthase